MNEQNIRCIICPIGCTARVKISGGKCTIQEGYKCKHGFQYAENESLNPQRVVTSSILVEGGEWPLVSVKTSRPVPKEMVFPIMEVMKKQRIHAPVSMGQVVIRNVLGLNADIVTTKSIKKK